MWQRISKSRQYLVPAACALALAACAQNPRPDGAVAPAGNYGGTVVAYPVGDMVYGYPFDYGYYGGYGYSPYAVGGYGYSPYAYGYNGYPLRTAYPPVVRVYRSPQLGKLAPQQNGRYGLQPWGGKQLRVAVPRPPAPPITQRSFAPPPRARQAPMPRQAQPRPSGRH